MTSGEFIKVFYTIAEAPGGGDRLREVVLQLAVRGRLVTQNCHEEPADWITVKLKEGKKRLLADKTIPKPRYPFGVPVEQPPYEIPKTWQWLRLGDVGSIVGGGTPKSSEPTFWTDGEDIPWLTPADMRQQTSRYVERGRRDISAEGLRKSSAQMLPRGSVLFSSRAPIGHVGIAANPLSTNQGFKSCVPFVPAMSEYLYLFLRYAGPGINAQASGTTFKEVAGKNVALIPVSIPPLSEQHRIVAKVDELMGLIDLLEDARSKREELRSAARNSALDALRNASTTKEVRDAWTRIADRMDELFVDPTDLDPLREAVLQLAVRGRLVRQNGHDEPFETLTGKLKDGKERLLADETIPRPRYPSGIPVDRPPFQVPRTWQWLRLGDVGSIVGGGTPKSGEPTYWSDGQDIPWLTPADMRRQTSRYVEKGRRDITLEGLARSSAQMLPRGSVLFSSRAPIGHVGIAANPLSTNQGFKSCVPFIPSMSEYLYLFLKFAGPDIDALASGTTFKEVAGKDVALIPVSIPPLTEQDRIVAKVDELMEQIDRLEQHLRAREGIRRDFASAVCSFAEQGIGHV